MARFTYLLGDSARESARLKAQARLWDPVSTRLFDRLRIRRGWKILEVGPGRGSLHRELSRRAGAPVDAVERSPAFAADLRRRGGRTWECDLLDADLPANRYDLVFARWVFLFLPDPGAHVRKLARALKPGGLLAIQDYHRETLAMIPRPPEWDAFLAADRAFFASEGGDASIAGLLPGLYRGAGLDLVDWRPEIKVGVPGSPEWNWMTEYFLGVLGRMAAFRPFTPAKAAALRRRWIAASRSPEARLVAPAVVDVVGRKRR